MMNGDLRKILLKWKQNGEGGITGRRNSKGLHGRGKRASDDHHTAGRKTDSEASMDT